MLLDKLCLSRVWASLSLSLKASDVTQQLGKIDL